MSYGAAKQLLVAGLVDTATLMKAAENWPDRIKFLHAQIGCRAYEYIQSNIAYQKAQKAAMDAGVVAAEQRIHLHNAVAEWMNALEAEKPAAAVDPQAGATTS
jgi:hypothetical protein